MTSSAIDLIAPMHARAPMIENKIATAAPSIFTAHCNPGLSGIVLVLRSANAGSTKSKGVNPTAPQTDTKSPKKGIAAETSVITAMYADVYVSRHRQDLQLMFFFA